jgi:hypothetical protein
MNLDQIVIERRRKAHAKRVRKALRGFKDQGADLLDSPSFRPSDPPASYPDIRAKRKAHATAKARAREELTVMRHEKIRDALLEKGRVAHRTLHPDYVGKAGE